MTRLAPCSVQVPTILKMLYYMSGSQLSSSHPAATVQTTDTGGSGAGPTYYILKDSVDMPFQLVVELWVHRITLVVNFSKAGYCPIRMSS